MLDCQKGLFSLPPDLHYLNCAYMAPLPVVVEAAGIDGMRRKRIPSTITAEMFFSESDELRDRFAQLIGAADPRRIAILPSSSYGMAVAARNTPVQPHQNVVVIAEEFPSSYYTWQRRCRDAGAELRVVDATSPAVDGEPESRGAAWNRVLLAAIDEHTAAVCMPCAHWSDGTLFDVASVRRRTHEVGAALVVDGTQTVGSLPFDVANLHPDALVCAAYKTLFGPYSMSLGYFGERFDGGVPLEDNWAPRVGSEEFSKLAGYCDELRPAAARYDVGERSNFILVPMMSAALDLVLSWGPAAVQEYCAALSAAPLAELTELGYRIAPPQERTSHLFGIRPPAGIEPDEMRRSLEQRRVVVSVRGDAVRVSPNVYNDAVDLRALRDALHAVTGRQRSRVG